MITPSWAIRTFGPRVLIGCGRVVDPIDVAMCRRVSCSLSLASILTGLYPHQHKVTSNDPPLPAGKVGRAALLDPGYRCGS